MSSNPHILSYIESSEITLSVAPEAFMASKIAHAVEDGDANLLGLRILDAPLSDSRMGVSLLVGRRDPGPVVRSLERYGFEVIEAAAHESADDETARARARELLHYLEL